MITARSSKISSASANGTKSHENWTSRFAFLMASIGFAVGLGNIWKFPYITGENGGGAFVLIYLLCAFGIGVPILMAEILIGRRGKQSPNVSMGTVASQEGASSHWHWLGAMTMLTAFLILVVYCVVSGWVLQYLYIALTDGFTGISNGTSAALFANVLANPIGMIFWTALALSLTALIVSAGVKNGIERAVTFLMPALFILLLVMVTYAAYAGDFDQGLRFLFSADFTKINAKTVLVAIGQAFFSVGVAMAAIMTYGAYLPKTVSIGRSALIIVFADTLVAILAGLAIFPLVFQYGMDPQGGPGLIFEALPLAFAQMPGGHFFSVVFFTLLSVAAITSMVGLLEPLVSWAEEHKNINRRKGGLWFCVLILTLSLLSIFSYNHLADIQLLAWLPGFADRNFNSAVEFLTDQLTLPIGGLLIAIFAGWIMSDKSSREELGLANQAVYQIWRFLVRYIVPPALILVLLLGLTGKSA